MVGAPIGFDVVGDTTCGVAVGAGSEIQFELEQSTNDFVAE